MLIQAYSATSLTNPLDKLPAIAGIAKKISTERTARYAAGVFLDDIPSGLLWSCESPEYGPGNPYIAPSWSWASRRSVVSFQENPPGWEFGQFATVENASLEYADTSNPFGRVERGSLTITGPMARLSWTGNEKDGQVWAENFELGQADSTKDFDDFQAFRLSLDFDELNLARPMAGVSFLLLSHLVFKIFGLILAPVDKSTQPQTWRRIGMFWLTAAGNPDSDKLGEDAIQLIMTYPKTTLKLV